MTAPWITEARRRLLDLQAPGGGWGYRPGGELAAEPTILAAVGLLATDETDDRSAAPAARMAAGWIAGLQRGDGAVGVSVSRPTPEWPTPFAVLLWRSVGGFEPERRLAVDWLLGRKGLAFEQQGERIMGHDTTIVGWPWVAETHSWLEPTALAVTALTAEGFGGHSRVRDGLRLIRDRAIPGSGWNYGNSAAFGTPLRPQPAPTGLALLALAGAESAGNRLVDAGCRWLERALAETRSPQSLSWGLRGLTAWGRRPAAADDWLAEAFALVPHRPDPVLQLGYLLTAGTVKER